MTEVSRMLVITVSFLDKEDRGMDIQKFINVSLKNMQKTPNTNRGKDKLDLLSLLAPKSHG